MSPVAVKKSGGENKLNEWHYLTKWESRFIQSGDVLPIGILSEAEGLLSCFFAHCFLAY